ncbi:MAG: hypothetical protein ABS78_19995 [Phenylobacterium sp. SCN 70-31]|nr:MAG: hypothetical protein ABS78_19995 [Phenylobacterium sp. SCN 70-31]
MKSCRCTFPKIRSAWAGAPRLASRSKGSTAPGMLLQKPTPRFPRTSICRMRSPLPVSEMTLTSLNCSREASSGLRPVFAMNRT